MKSNERFGSQIFFIRTIHSGSRAFQTAVLTGLSVLLANRAGQQLDQKRNEPDDRQVAVGIEKRYSLCPTDLRRRNW